MAVFVNSNNILKTVFSKPLLFYIIQARFREKPSLNLCNFEFKCRPLSWSPQSLQWFPMPFSFPQCNASSSSRNSLSQTHSLLLAIPSSSWRRECCLALEPCPPSLTSTNRRGRSTPAPPSTLDPPSSPLPRSPVSITNQPYINTNIEPRSLTLFIISRSEIETETETEERERKNEGAIVSGIRRQRRCSTASSSPETERLRSRTRFRPLVWALLGGTRVSRQGHWGKLFLPIQFPLFSSKFASDSSSELQICESYLSHFPISDHFDLLIVWFLFVLFN